MNKELSWMTSISRKLPKVKVSGVLLNRIVIPFYNRKKREEEVVDVHGFQMKLDPGQCVDSGLLFYPQLYDHKELEAIKNIIGSKDTILDVGGHIGFYSLYLSGLVTGGRIIAIEADPSNYRRFMENLQLNPKIKNVEVRNFGVSDKTEVLSMGISTSGNTSGNSFLSKSQTRVEVPCKPLYDFLKEEDLEKIDFMKIDIEGFEYRVFKKFFEQAPVSLYPKYILMEDNAFIPQEGNALALLEQHGYSVLKDLSLNKLLQHKA
ncbi:MAG: FkbM family methyltransferase [Saprospiraceae bacterium]|nr:FkbM family methyltransferase [Saprospiraceae bacterium]